MLDGAYHGHTRPLMGLSSYKARQQKYPAIQPNTRAWIVRVVGVASGCGMVDVASGCGMMCVAIAILYRSPCLTVTEVSLEVKVHVRSMYKKLLKYWTKLEQQTRR